MTQRTCNIIMCCKGNGKYSKLEAAGNVIKYLSHECNCPENIYNYSEVNKILFEALMDYIDGVEKPSSVIRSLREYGTYCNNMNDMICNMFANVQVREFVYENDFSRTGPMVYVNGFTEELINQSKKDLNW